MPFILCSVVKSTACAGPTQSTFSTKEAFYVAFRHQINKLPWGDPALPSETLEASSAGIARRGPAQLVITLLCDELMHPSSVSAQRRSQSLSLQLNIGETFHRRQISLRESGIAQ
jgi:hypothetical protein